MSTLKESVCRLRDKLRPYRAPNDTLCLFLSFVPDGNHAVDLRLISHLQKIFPNFLVLTNTPPAKKTFPFRVYPNQGYDFGYWHKATEAYDLVRYSRLVLINNSNLLSRRGELSSAMRWGEASGLDFWGLTDSHEAPRGMDEGSYYHVQSHFMVFEKKSLVCLADFFAAINFPRFYAITDPVVLRDTIINECEIGLTQYMLGRGMRAGAMFAAKDFVPSVSGLDWRSTNMHMTLWEELLKAGYPLIKKKVAHREWSFLPNIARVDRYL